MTKRRVLGAILFVGLLGGAWFLRGVLADDVPLKGVDRSGFAIWPQDTVGEARASCRWQAFPPSTPAVAERFSEQVLAAQDQFFGTSK